MTVHHYTPTLDDAYSVFMLDQRARGHTPKTQDFYRWTLRPFIAFLAGVDVARLGEVTPHHIRTHLNNMRERGLKGSTCNGAARSIRAFFQLLRSGGILRGVAHE